MPLLSLFLSFDLGISFVPYIYIYMYIFVLPTPSPFILPVAFNGRNNVSELSNRSYRGGISPFRVLFNGGLSKEAATEEHDHEGMLLSDSNVELV